MSLRVWAFTHHGVNATLAGNLWDDRHTPGWLQPGKTARQRRARCGGGGHRRPPPATTRQAVCGPVPSGGWLGPAGIAIAILPEAVAAPRGEPVVVDCSLNITGPASWPRRATQTSQQHKRISSCVCVQNNARRRLPVSFSRAPYDLVRSGRGSVWYAASPTADSVRWAVGDGCRRPRDRGRKIDFGNGQPQN